MDLTTGHGRLVTRGKIQDAISAWRDGATFDAIHPLRDSDSAERAILWDDNAMKDLARVITATLAGEEVPVADLPWSPPHRPGARAGDAAG